MSELGNRGEYIGGSDLAGLMGISPWNTPRAVLKEKILGVSREFSSAATEYGKENEKILLDGDQMTVGYRTLDDESMTVDDFGFPLILHFDRVAKAGAESDGEIFPVECKTSSTAFNGILPIYYLPQVQAYIFGLSKKYGNKVKRARIVFGLRTDDCQTNEGFWVERDDKYWTETVAPVISDAVSKIKTGRERLATGEDIDEILDDLCGKSSYEVAELMGTDVAAQAAALFKMAEDAEAGIKAFKDSLKKIMKDKQIKKATFGNYTVSLSEDTVRKSFDEEQFAKKFPQAFDDYKIAKETCVKESKVSGALRITKKGE